MSFHARHFRILLVALAAFVSSCAPAPQVAPARYDSADHKNIVMFLRAYQDAWNGRDETAIKRLYADRFREVPLLFQGGRALGGRGFEDNLGSILKAEAKAGLVQEALSPIEYKISGDTATVAVYFKISYSEDSKGRSGFIRRTMNLRKLNYFWKIEFSHFEFMQPSPWIETLSPL